MPKILRIINRFNLGGPTYNVTYLTKYLAPEFETLLIGGDKEEGEDSSAFITEKEGLQPLIIPELKREVSLSNDRKAYKRIKELIREFKPDIVHTHASKAGAVGRFAAIHSRVPVIVHTFHGHVFHSYFGKAKTGVYKGVERYLAKKSSAVVAISELQKKELVEIHKVVPPEKAVVIPLGFDLSRFTADLSGLRRDFREKYAVAKDEIVISIIGRLAPVKNHRMFLDVISAIKKQLPHSPIRGFVIGDGELMNDLQAYAKSLGLTIAGEGERADVTFTSWIRDVEFALAGSDIICLTSHNEGTPVSLIEAQAAGKVVLSTDVGGVRDIIAPGAGYVCSPGNVLEMSNKLNELLNNSQIFATAKSFGPAFAVDHFHYTRLVADMRSLYYRLLKEK